MDLPLNVLDNVRIASPCPLKWDDLEGDGAVRHCNSCQHSVYNLSEMTRADAEAFVRNAEGRACVTFYRRADGTIMTKDCPVGLRAIRRRAAKTAGRIAAALGVLLAGSFVFGRIAERLAPAVPPAPSIAAPGPLMGEMIMGGMRAPVTRAVD